MGVGGGGGAGGRGAPADPEVAEIGHIATHPAHRRRGLAAAAIRALVGDLLGQTERIFLTHLAGNDEAGAAI